MLVVLIKEDRRLFALWSCEAVKVVALAQMSERLLRLLAVVFGVEIPGL